MPYKGKFKPANPEKYTGNPENIIYRSSWELKVMKYLDTNPNVIYWASEELFIPYISPVDQREHRYFPDFIIKTKKKDGNLETYMIEIKPEIQTKAPEKRSKRTRKFLNEIATYSVNQAKWRAADIYCQKKGWKFMVLTERDIGIKKTYK